MNEKGQLVYYRKKAGLTQVQLARQIGVSQQTMSSYERAVTTPKPYQMQQLEEILHVDKEVLFFNEFYKRGGSKNVL
ncbi:helix-turn-helix transcriptional regulator [uncultured Enterococcus sp.]|uniref:helix-turn-helix transcriptional regulator n=1 Tax=uncultured Enterococcus sp. TaxID=167972 RepID=UPI002AA95942|nr:helix-turn-helix transcriptional regulator [uncultured Enterococcus sp.]